MGFRKLLFAALALAVAPAYAQSFPTKAVRVIISFTPGSATDIVGRVVSAKLSEYWGQPVVAENRAGAGGSIGSAVVAKSAPDGYTLLMMSNTHTVNETLRPNRPFNLMRDFVGIAPVNYSDLIMVVHPSVPAKDLKELIALARRDPGKLTMASPGQGTTNHLLSELMQSTLGVQWLTVHYRGNAPALNDLIGGQVQFALDQISVGLPSIKSGTLRALAVTGSQRARWLPDVPTFTELGYKEFDGQTFTGLFAPAGTPPEIVAKLHSTLAEILKDPAIIEKFNNLGAEAVSMTPAEFTSYLEREDAKWIPIVRKANIKAN